jgi:TetR/AcrR family tetracycline transcriptional repressor
MADSKLKLVTQASGGRPAKISREGILAVARLLGPGEFTFQHIAKKLGVQPPALYYHFSSRDEVLNALALELAREFALQPGNPKRWRPWLEDTALRFYDFLVANPALFEVGNWRGVADFGMPIIEAVLETLEGAGYSPEEAGRTWEVVSHLAYSEARIINEIRRTGPAPAAAITAARRKAASLAPRTAAWTAKGNPEPREHLAGTLHWLVAALPRPRRS